MKILILMLLPFFANAQLVTAKTDYVAKSELDHFKEVISLKFAETEKALGIQAIEYERRLEVLNHEAEQLKVMQATYLSREVFDVSQRDTANKIESLQKIVWVGIGIFSVIQIAIAFFLKNQKAVRS